MELVIISLLHHERNPAAFLAFQLGSARVPTTLPQDIPAHPLWEHHIDKGCIHLPPAPHPSYFQPPKLWPPKAQPHPTTPLCAWVVAQPGYCLAQLPSTYFMHMQTTQRRWPGSSGIKKNNVLPRSLANTPNSAQCCK